MFFIKKISLLIFICLNCVFFNAHCSVKFYFIFNNSNLGKNEIKIKTDFIINNVKAKKNTFEILHYSKNKEIIDNWITNKSQIKYIPTKTDCEFDICNNLSTILSISKTDKSRIYAKQKLMCIIDLEKIDLNDNDQSTIIRKINDELSRLDKDRNNQVIYFIFDNEISEQNLTLKFNSEKINAKEGDEIILKPEITGNISKYEWLPNEGLSCNNCQNPKLKIIKSISYELKITDSIGCNSVSKIISIEIDKNCVCKKGISKNEIIFGDPKINKVIRAEEENYEWKILSNVSGDFIFNVVSKSNCFKKFKLIVVNQNNKEYFNEEYLREDVDFNSKNYYHLNGFPDHLVFQIDVSDQKKEMREKINKYFRIIIIPFDEDGDLCYEAKYISPKIDFKSCEER